MRAMKQLAMHALIGGALAMFLGYTFAGWLP